MTLEKVAHVVFMSASYYNLTKVSILPEVPTLLVLQVHYKLAVKIYFY